MPPRLYPIFLNLKNRPCLVVGGGPVALRKARGLRRAGARVTVVAPTLVPGFRRLKGVAVRRRPFQLADVGKNALVFAATDRPAVNRRVAALGRRRRVWVNVADASAPGDFHVPAVARRGAIALALSTGGASPALAKSLAKRLKGALTPARAALARRRHALRAINRRLFKTKTARKKR